MRFAQGKPYKEVGAVHLCAVMGQQSEEGGAHILWGALNGKWSTYIVLYSSFSYGMGCRLNLMHD